MLVALGLLGGSLLVALTADAPVAASSPTGWNIIPSPNTSPSADNLLLGGTCVDAFDCWSVGLVSTNFNNGTFRPLLESWNGTSWSIAKSPKPPAGSQYALIDTTCLNDSDCWAVGATLNAQNKPSSGLTMHWNGSSWAAAPSPASGPGGALLVSVTCATTSDCWAAGTIMVSGNPSAALLEHWDGSKWSLSSLKPSGQTYEELNAVTCVGPSDCWAVGTAGPNPQNSNFIPIFPGAVGDQGWVEHWNGKVWSVVPNPIAKSPDTGRYLAGVTCLSRTNCWISGTSTNSNGTSGPTLMEHWSGSSWAVVLSPAPVNASGAILSSVSCLDATECWAAGSTNSFGNNNLEPASFVESWNGAKWTIQSSPNVTALSFLRNVSCVRGTGCWAVGTSVTNVGGNSPLFQTLIEQLQFPPSSVQGLWMVSSRGRVYTFGQARRYAPRRSRTIRSPVVAIAATPDRKGYWLLHANGAVFEFGDATFHGSPKASALRRPIVGMAPTPSGLGYWLVASNGRVFDFGDASPHGSLTGAPAGTPIVGISATPDGEGYWLVSVGGRVFPFGDAKTYPSHVAALERPLAGMAVTPDGRGYWLVTAGGNVHAFGDAKYYGSPTGQGITSPVPITSLVATPDGRGYWVVGENGSVYEYGDALFLNSLGGRRPPSPIVSAASH